MRQAKKTPPASWLDRSRAALLWVRAHLPQLTVWARYALPVLSALVLFAMGWCYNVNAARVGNVYELSLWRLHFNTLSHARAEFAQSASSGFYTVLSVAAAISLFCFALATALVCFALFCAIEALRQPKDSERQNRKKMLFRVIFPNRVCAFLPSVLLVVPTFYPHFVSLVGSRFLEVGGEEMLFLLSNPPLVVMGVLTLLTLVLAVLEPRFARRKGMNLFLVRHLPSSEEQSKE